MAEVGGDRRHRACPYIYRWRPKIARSVSAAGWKCGVHGQNAKVAKMDQRVKEGYRGVVINVGSRMILEDDRREFVECSDIRVPT